MLIANRFRKINFSEPRFSRDGIIIFIALLPQIIVIWTATILFTQDGPVHLYISTILNNLSESAATSGLNDVATYYEENWRIVPNLLGYLILQPLIKIFGAITAEKILVTIYIITLPYAIYFAAKALKAQPLLAVLLSFPLLTTSALYIGFYNYSFSLVFFVLGLALWVKIETKEDVSLSSLVCLGIISLLAFVSHAMGFSILLLICASGSLIYRFMDFRVFGLSSAARNFIKYTLPIGLCLFPGFLMFVYFLTQESVHAAQLTLIDQALWGSNEDAPYFFLKSLKNRIISFLGGEFIFADRALRVILVLGLFLMSYAKIREGNLIPKKGAIAGIPPKDSSPQSLRNIIPWLLLLLLAVTLLFPPISFNTRFVAERILPFIFLFLVFWLATYTTLPTFVKILIAIIFVVNVAIPLKRIDELSNTYDKYQEYQFAEQYLAPGKTFMVFNLRNQKDATRLGFFLHEGKRLALNTGAINLKVIQARSPFPVIPIKYIDGKSPFPSIIETSPSPYLHESINPLVYQEQTSVKIDYLLYWGIQDHKMPTSFKDYFKTIEADYTLIATSPGRGMMKIYQLNEP